MSNRVSRVVLCFVVALAMAFGSSLSHPTHSLSHDPASLSMAEAERHAQLEAEIAEHGHSHDHGGDHERAAGHSHGHNPADHSHETPTAPPAIAATLPALVRTWLTVPPSTVTLGAIGRLERPPIVIA